MIDGIIYASQLNACRKSIVSEMGKIDVYSTIIDCFLILSNTFWVDFRFLLFANCFYFETSSFILIFKPPKLFSVSIIFGKFEISQASQFPVVTFKSFNRLKLALVSAGELFNPNMVVIERLVRNGDHLVSI